MFFKAKHNIAFKYLQELVAVKQSEYTLHTSTSTVLHVPKTQTAYGDYAFICIAPSLWDKLPEHIHNLPSFETFKGHVESNLYASHISWIVKLCFNSVMIITLFCHQTFPVNYTFMLIVVFSLSNFWFCNILCLYMCSRGEQQAAL